MTYQKKVTLNYSKNQVDEAGKLLIQGNLSKKQSDFAFEVLNNWRAVHDYPMNTFQSFLRKKIKSLRYSAIVVERLKRTTSIIGKLKRNPDMKLSRIQDIGGLRVIVKNVDYVYKLRDILSLKSKFLHKLIKEDDYIRKPKASGYRSLHLVYKYHSQYAPEYNGLLLEIQLRTELQHIRATAVETAGIILQTNLKAGEGTKDRLEFFMLVSSIFAINEGCVPLQIHQGKDIDDLKQQLRNLEKKLQATKELEKYRHTTKFIDTKLSKKQKAYEYYLLILDMENTSRTVYGYKDGELEKATQDYLKREHRFKNENKGQVVLVSGESIKILKSAYPNYFLDIEKFVALLRNIIK